MLKLNKNIVKDIFNVAFKIPELREHLSNKINFFKQSEFVFNLYGVPIEELIEDALINFCTNNIVIYSNPIADPLSIDFVRFFKDNIDFGYLSRSRYLSEDIVREFYNQLDIKYILTRYTGHYFNLSENFIATIKTFG